MNLHPLRLTRTKILVALFANGSLAVGAGAAFMTSMPGSSFRGSLPPLTTAQAETAGRLRSHVVAIAEVVGERHQARGDSLGRAERWVTEQFQRAGLEPKRLPYSSLGVEVANLEATVRGTTLPDEIVVVGAHYDSAEEAPGADDNASGVALLIELLGRVRSLALSRTVRFVAFANEEPPHFWRETMGSLHYARACKAEHAKIVAMLSLESVGYFKSEPGTQKYPPVVSLAYPTQGNFIGFVGNIESRALVRSSVEAFRRASSFPSEGAALPGMIQGVGWSDQSSFWKMGYPALMVTDTAPFRNPHYHTSHDTPDTLDYAAMARIADGIEAVTRELATNPK